MHINYIDSVHSIHIQFINTPGVELFLLVSVHHRPNIERQITMYNFFFFIVAEGLHIQNPKITTMPPKDATFFFLRLFVHAFIHVIILTLSIFLNM